MKGFRGILLLTALFLATVLPAGSAAAHGGYWHTHYRTVCLITGACLQVPWWHYHEHSPAEEREKKFQQCIATAKAKYQRTLNEIERSKASEEQKKARRQAAYNTLKIDTGRCWALYRGGFAPEGR